MNKIVLVILLVISLTSCVTKIYNLNQTEYEIEKNQYDINVLTPEGSKIIVTKLNDNLYAIKIKPDSSQRSDLISYSLESAIMLTKEKYIDLIDAFKESLVIMNSKDTKPVIFDTVVYEREELINISTYIGNCPAMYYSNSDIKKAHAIGIRLQTIRDKKKTTTIVFISGFLIDITIDDIKSIIEIKE